MDNYYWKIKNQFFCQSCGQEFENENTLNYHKDNYCKVNLKEKINKDAEVLVDNFANDGTFLNLNKLNGKNYIHNTHNINYEINNNHNENLKGLNFFDAFYGQKYLDNNKRDLEEEFKNELLQNTKNLNIKENILLDLKKNNKGNKLAKSAVHILTEDKFDKIVHSIKKELNIKPANKYIANILSQNFHEIDYKEPNIKEIDNLLYEHENPQIRLNKFKQFNKEVIYINDKLNLNIQDKFTLEISNILQSILSKRQLLYNKELIFIKNLDKFKKIYKKYLEWRYFGRTIPIKLFNLFTNYSNNLLKEKFLINTENNDLRKELNKVNASLFYGKKNFSTILLKEENIINNKYNINNVNNYNSKLNNVRLNIENDKNLKNNYYHFNKLKELNNAENYVKLNEQENKNYFKLLNNINNLKNEFSNKHKSLLEKNAFKILVENKNELNQDDVNYIYNKNLINYNEYNYFKEYIETLEKDRNVKKNVYGKHIKTEENKDTEEKKMDSLNHENKKFISFLIDNQKKNENYNESIQSNININESQEELDEILDNKIKLKEKRIEDQFDYQMNKKLYLEEKINKELNNFKFKPNNGDNSLFEEKKIIAKKKKKKTVTVKKDAIKSTKKSTKKASKKVKKVKKKKK